MSGQWPSDTSALSTLNFDQDTDTVTGPTGAREDLKDLIDILNVMLASIDANSIPYTNTLKGTIAFKDVNNTFTEPQKVSSYISLGRDTSSASQVYLQFYNANYSTLHWQTIVDKDSSGAAYIIKSGGNKLVLKKDAQTLTTTSTGITYGSSSLQMAATKQTFSTNYSAGGSGWHPHSMGRYPDFIRMALRCITADAGYSVGDVIDISASSLQFSFRDDRHHGIQITYGNSYSLLVSIGQSGYPILYNNQTYFQNIVNGRWVIDATAWWF